MKKLNVMLICPLLIMGFALIFSNGCKKDSNNTNPAPGQTVTDIDGNVYPAVTIGTQTWMAANLKTTKYRNGTPIPKVSDSLQWTLLTTPGYCNYNNDPNTVSAYGLYYNWYAVTDSNNNIAPAGWHVPTDAEWTTLTNYLGTGAGGKLKSTGTNYWNSPNASATNSTGFNGMPGGDRSYDAIFHYLGTYGCFWCTTENSATDAWEHVLSCNSGNLLRMAYSKDLGLNIRCVKD